MPKKKKNDSILIESSKIESTIEKLYSDLRDDAIAKMVRSQADCTIDLYDYDPDSIKYGVELGLKLAEKRAEQENPDLRVYFAENDEEDEYHFFIADEKNVCERLKNRLLHLIEGATVYEEDDE